MSTTRRKRDSAMYSDFQDATEEVGEFIAEQMKERPYAGLAVAAALGYALGLPRGALALVTGLGTRVALGWFQSLLEEAPATRAAPRRRSRRATNS